MRTYIVARTRAAMSLPTACAVFSGARMAMSAGSSPHDPRTLPEAPAPGGGRLREPAKGPGVVQSGAMRLNAAGASGAEDGARGPDPVGRIRLGAPMSEPEAGPESWVTPLRPRARFPVNVAATSGPIRLKFGQRHVRCDFGAELEAR